jgi:hypothetical protein
MLRLECDCCGSVLAVTEKGQGNALFQKTAEPRCPACHGYLFRKETKKESPVSCFSCEGLEQTERSYLAYRCKIRDKDGIDPGVKEPCSAYIWNGAV